MIAVTWYTPSSRSAPTPTESIAAPIAAPPSRPDASPGRVHPDVDQGRLSAKRTMIQNASTALAAARPSPTKVDSSWLCPCRTCSKRSTPSRAREEARARAAKTSRYSTMRVTGNAQNLWLRVRLGPGGRGGRDGGEENGVVEENGLVFVMPLLTHTRAKSCRLPDAAQAHFSAQHSG